MEKLSEDFLREHVDCYDFFTQEERKQVINSAFLMKAAKDETLLTSDSPCLGVMFLISGRLRTYLISDDGREVDLFFVEPGEVSVLTASCILRTITFEVHIQADEPSEAIVIPSSTFGDIQQENMKIENFVLKVATERFSDVMWTMQQLLFLPVQQRVAIFLHDEYIRTGSTELQVTHKQIAQALGTAREVVTRILRLMTEKHIISVSRGTINILDKKELFRQTQ